VNRGGTAEEFLSSSSDERFLFLIEAIMMEFHLFESEFLRLYHAGSYADAMDWLRLGGGQFPEKAATLYFWRACISALIGQPDQALLVLEQGYNLGYWWAESLLRGDSDLAALQELPGFNDLVPQCEARRLEAEKHHPPEAIFYPPEPGSPAPYPLLLGFHGRNSSAETLAQPLLTVTSLGWALALIRSSQMLLPGGFAWDDRQRAREDVQSMIEEVSRLYPIDRGRIVAAGFSQGGGLALELALSGCIRPRGVITFAPYPNFSEIAGVPVNHDFKVSLGTGELDTGQAIFSKIERFLQAQSIPYQRQQFPNLGHDLPAHLEGFLYKAFEYLLSD
jgi:predicted esterase